MGKQVSVHLIILRAAGFFFFFKCLLCLKKPVWNGIKKRSQGHGGNDKALPHGQYISWCMVFVESSGWWLSTYLLKYLFTTGFPFVPVPVTKGSVSKRERIESHFNYLKKLNHFSLSIILFHVFYLLLCAFKVCHDRYCLLLCVCRIWRKMGKCLGETHDILLNKK